MRTMNRNLVVLAAAVFLALATASCNSTDLDDGGGPDVVLEVQTTTVPPITAAQDPAGGCTFTVTNASATLVNRPKNLGADTQPFNDVILENVIISYVWDDDPAVITPPATFALGANVPANGTGTVQFVPIEFDQLDGRDGHTASIDMVFVGRTVSGQRITADGGATLVVNSCI